MGSLVSVSLPCFESRRTLGRALASLLAQSYEDWECVFVDDGSTDRPLEVVEQAADPRIRAFRLPENRGRGAARHLALAEARGDFHCMLDADDWLYPERIERQLEVFRGAPDVDLVGAGVAVVDRANRLLGVRRVGPPGAGLERFAPATGWRRIPVGHPSSMVRMPAARRAGYDPTFRRFEDKEFLLRILARGPFALLPRPIYAYREAERFDLAAALASARSARGVYRRQRRRLGGAYRSASATLAAKALAYRLAAVLGLGGWLLRRRSRPATEADRMAFETARRAVDATYFARFEDEASAAG